MTSNKIFAFLGLLVAMTAQATENSITIEHQDVPLNYLYSHNAKSYHGYTLAKNKEGKCFIFTAALEDDKVNDYRWGDIKFLGKYKPEDLVIEPSIKECKNRKDVFSMKG